MTHTANGNRIGPRNCSKAAGPAAQDARPAPKPSRPVLRYHGGKWVLAPWIISHFPRHKVYVEPYGGAASVLLRKAPAYAEVYNDLSGKVVNFFRVLRDPEQSRALGRQLRLTPFSREEFEHAWDAVPSKDSPSKDSPSEHPAPDVERARRLAGVVIERRDALEVIRQQDRPHTLFYVDPPYLPGVRGERWQEKAYQHEMDAAEHEELAALLHEVDGMVILSGYASELYRDCYEAHGWARRERSAYADGAREKRDRRQRCVNEQEMWGDSGRPAWR